MRDTRKNEEYFEKYLEFQYSRIEKKYAKLAEADDIKKQRVLMSLTGYEIDLLKAEFSFGATKEKMKSLLSKAVSIVTEYRNITYEDLLNLLSMSIMLNEINESLELIRANKDKVFNDRLLNALALFIQGKEPVWNDSLALPKDFAELDKVFKSPAKDSELLAYLNSWYDNHSGYSWYNSHLSTNDTYCGYWSFESAAIAIILGISDSKLKDSKYYPFWK